MTADEILAALVKQAGDSIYAAELAFSQGARRCDFWTISANSSSGFKANAYEIKVSRADFKRDSAIKQRRAPTPDALDYFPTPPWVTRALCEWLARRGEPLDAYTVWEPACGEGHMARPLAEYFGEVRATDVHQYGANEICDFLALRAYAPRLPVQWVITNPPFLVADQFITIAREVAQRGVAMLVRTAFLEGQERYRNLFSTHHRPSHILQMSERAAMLRGRLIEVGKPDPFNLDDDGKPRTASSATSYCWLIWLPGAGNQPTQFDWLPPCRTALERAGDYPEYPEQWAKIAPEQGGLL